VVQRYEKITNYQLRIYPHSPFLILNYFRIFAKNTINKYTLPSIRMKKIIVTFVFILLCFCAFAQLQTISVNEFEKQLINSKGEQLIDVRTPQEYERYRIPGAKNINFRSPEFRKQIEHLDKNKSVLIYCLAGPRSKSAMEIFRQAGFKTVYELNGGVNAWLRAGKDIEQDSK